MDIAPSLVRTRKLARKTALRRRLVRVNARRDSAVFIIGRFILDAQRSVNRPLNCVSHSSTERDQFGGLFLHDITRMNRR